VAIVEHIESVNGRAAMIFHGYCDNENTKYRRVAFVFTLYGDGRNWGEDRFVDEVLSERWRNDLDKDKIEPLLSRIGNMNVFVTSETNEVLTVNTC